MGSPISEPERDDDEVQHQVTISRDFWLGKYEVTQAQWKAVMGNNPSHFKKFFKRGDNNPVEQVRWEDAKNFCDKLNSDSSISRPSGYRFDLPTEAQWEFACRGGNQNRNYLYSGSNTPGNVAWYELGYDIGKTNPVGQKSPNELGFHDMSGNVSEWCRDWYGDYPSNSVTDPHGTPSGSRHVFRGGSFGYIASCCRAADRFTFSPEYWGPSPRDSTLGFRLALVPEP